MICWAMLYIFYSSTVVQIHLVCQCQPAMVTPRLSPQLLAAPQRQQKSLKSQLGRGKHRRSLQESRVQMLLMHIYMRLEMLI